MAASADRAARDEGKAAADQLSLDISNLILSIADIDVTSGTYAADAQNMSTLGNYLRNRMDALDACWRRALAVEDPAARADEIASYLSSSVAASWKGQFDQAYEAMAPQAR
ncbi:hypothetical protein [Olsenella massiliensis]|uniref:hypothetical protein n=1 Tax=Olsenella massiliensis TaxID=1622075 RepID=UPI00071D73BB|nr:hypothetical protein [Olsenella massiliensis]